MLMPSSSSHTLVAPALPYGEPFDREGERLPLLWRGAREGRGDLGPGTDAAAALVLETVELLRSLLPALRTKSASDSITGKSTSSNAIRIIRRFDERSFFIIFFK
jgi:hypothetical protein